MGPKAASTKKATTSKPKPNHPTYKVMISHAIAALKERFGSSQHAIIKYIENNYNVGDSENFKKQLRMAIKRLIKEGTLVQIKQSFKLSEDGRKDHKSESGAATKPSSSSSSSTVVRRPATKKPAAKKPASTAGASSSAAPKKPVAKKVTKKPAAPNSAKVPSAAPAKKPAVKKAPAKKAPAKKAPAKK